jgi:hypothetical protein
LLDAGNTITDGLAGSMNTARPETKMAFRSGAALIPRMPPLETGGAPEQTTANPAFPFTGIELTPISGNPRHPAVGKP